MYNESPSFLRITGAGLIVFSFYFLGIASGLVQYNAGKLNAPIWISGIVGGIALAVGIALFTERLSQIRLIMVAVILCGFVVLSFWMVFIVEAESISGGFPFLSRSVNGYVAKGLIAIGFLFYPSMLKQLYRDIRTSG